MIALLKEHANHLGVQEVTIFQLVLIKLQKFAMKLKIRVELLDAKLMKIVEQIEVALLLNFVKIILYLHALIIFQKNVMKEKINMECMDVELI